MPLYVVRLDEAGLQEMLDAAKAWFHAMPHWPKLSPSTLGERNFELKQETAAYYGIQTLLNMLSSAGDFWPRGVTPSQFADTLDDMCRDRLRTHAKGFVYAEAVYELQ